MEIDHFDWDGVDQKAFTSGERALLKQYGSFYRRTMNGQEEIDNPEREHFVRMCETALKATGFVRPTTKHEKVWRKYLIKWHAKNDKPDTHAKRRTAQPRPKKANGKLKGNTRKITSRSRKPLAPPPVKEDTSKYRSNGPPPAKKIMTEPLSGPGPGTVIPEYEEGFPDVRWYSTRDRSSLNPYSKRRPGEQRP